MWPGAMSDESVRDPVADRPRTEYDEVAAGAADREFDWRVWTLVGMVILAFIVAPAAIYWLAASGESLAMLGLTWRDTFLVVPFVPALVLGLTAIWATARA